MSLDECRDHLASILDHRMGRTMPHVEFNSYGVLYQMKELMMGRTLSQ